MLNNWQVLSSTPFPSPNETGKWVRERGVWTGEENQHCFNENSNNKLNICKYKQSQYQTQPHYLQSPSPVILPLLWVWTWQQLGTRFRHWIMKLVSETHGLKAEQTVFLGHQPLTKESLTFMIPQLYTNYSICRIEYLVGQFRIPEGAAFCSASQTEYTRFSNDFSLHHPWYWLETFIIIAKLDTVKTCH